MACPTAHALVRVADDCERTLRKLGVLPKKCFGCGSEGCVFGITDLDGHKIGDKVLKLSVSPDEINFATRLKKEKHTGFPLIEDVVELKNECAKAARDMGIESRFGTRLGQRYDGPFYAIVREDVAPLEKVVHKTDRFNFAVCRMEATSKMVFTGERPFERIFDYSNPQSSVNWWIRGANAWTEEPALDEHDQDLVRQLVAINAWALKNGIFMRDLVVDNLGVRKKNGKAQLVIRDFGVNEIKGSKEAPETLSGIGGRRKRKFVLSGTRRTSAKFWLALAGLFGAGVVIAKGSKMQGCCS